MNSTICIYPIAFIEAGCLMYIRGDHRIFEKMIFAKVGLTLLILNKVRAQRGANDFGRGGKAFPRRVL